MVHRIAYRSIDALRGCAVAHDHDHRQMVQLALHCMTMIRSAALQRVNDATAISQRFATPKHIAFFGTIIQQVQSLI
jgi:hypothetical protein